MTISTLGAAASGGGGSSLQTPTKKRKITLYKSCRVQGGCAGGALDAANQERAWNSDGPSDPRHESVLAPALPPPPPPPPTTVQRPVKRWRGPSVEGISWAAKKTRSAVVAAAVARGNAIAEVNRAAVAAAATSSPIVQEPTSNWDGAERICRKDHLMPGGSAGEPVDERKEEKVRPCEFAAPVHGLDGLCQELKVAVLDLSLHRSVVQKAMKRDWDTNGEDVCWLPKNKKHYPTLCKERNFSVDKVNTALPSILSPRSQKVSKRLPVQKGKAPGGKRKTSSHSDGETTNPPFMTLSSRLQCLGVTNVTPILSKTLTCSDCRVNQARLLVTLSLAMDSPLRSMLTPYERRAVHGKNEFKGLPLEALDCHGRSYYMKYKYLYCNTSYRLIGQWARFLIENGIRSGDLVEVGAFRVDGILALTLMHHARQLTPQEEAAEAEAEAGVDEEWIIEEIDEVEVAKAELTLEVEKDAEGAKEKWTTEQKLAVDGAKEWTPEDKQAVEGKVMGWTPEEMQAAEGLIMLSDFKGQTKSGCAWNNALQLFKQINS